MYEFYASRVSNELGRLTKLGWTDLEIDQEGIKSATKQFDKNISYPDDFYDNLDENQDGIWAQHRAKEIEKRLVNDGIDLLWEVGSGSGNVAVQLRKAGIAVIAIEPLRNGAKITVREGFATYCATLDEIQFPSNSISSIGVFDVLEHIEYPELLLKEIYRILEPGGTLLTTVPAHQWLFSDFDVAIGHYRRYSKSSLKNLLSESNFTESKISFIFLIFVFPSLVLRRIPYLLGRKRNEQVVGKSLNSQNKVIHLIQPLLKLVLRLESKVSIPFGLSLISSSKKR
jgi:SAM-dependent methyltransferase